MAEHKKLSMLVKLDDGQTYTLGGDGADNAVTLDTEQTITGLKTFDKLPQSSVEPKADADLITKGYADGHYLPVDTKPHKYDILVKMKHDGTSWVGFSDFSVRLRDGTRLDIKHIENQSATTATKPVKAVFKTVKDLKAPIEAPTQQPATFFDSYKLEAGEFTGTVSFYKVVGKFGPAQNDINPWYVYVGNGNANNYDGIYAVSIDNLDKPLLGVNLKFGDAHNGYTYTCTQCGVVFTVDGSALEVAYDGDMSNAFETTIEYPINAQSMIGFVTVDTKQNINALKTFKVLPQSEAVPADDKDLVNKKYVDEKVGAGGGTGGAAPANMVTTDTAQNITEVKTFDKLPKSSAIPNADDDLINRLYATQTFVPLGVTTKVDIHFGSNNGNNWIGWDKLQIRLRDNSRLDVKYIEDVFKNEDRRPIRVVFTTVKNFSDPVTVHELKSIDFLNSYKLEAGEYFGYLTYGYGISGNSFSSSSRMDTPWTLMLFRMVNDKSNTVVRFEIEQLDKELKCIYFRIADGYSDGRQLYADSCQITYATAFGSTAVPYNGPFTYGTEVTVDLPENDPNVMKGYVVTIRSLEARIKALEDAAPKP